MRRRAEEEAARRARFDEAPITLKAGAAGQDERRAEFMRRVQAREAYISGQAEAVLEAATTPEDATAAQLQLTLFREASWIRRVAQFPNGKPLNGQNVRRVAVWEIFLAALDARVNGAEGLDLELPEDDHA